MRDKAEKWELEFVQVFKEFALKSNYSTIYHSAEVSCLISPLSLLLLFALILTPSFSLQISLEEELNSQINGDTVLIIISYVIVVVYVALTLGKFDWVQSKLLVSCAAVRA